MPFIPRPPSEPERTNPDDLAVTARWERPIIPATGGEATLLVRLTASPRLEPTRRAPLDVAFVLDRSGSMAGVKLALVKQAVDVAVGHLRDEDRAALVVYDHTVDVLHPLQPATPRGKTALRLALHGVDGGGSTDLGGGWLTGCRELSDAPPVPASTATRLRRALLLTDGLANVGITDPGELTTHAHELRKRGIGTTALGVGLDFDEALLSALAEAGGGNFQFVAGPEQLRPFFERELRELLAVAAVGLTVNVTAPADVEIDLINAFPTERRGDDLTVATGDLPAGDELDLLFAVRVPPGAVGDVRRLRLTAAWADPTADRRRTIAGEVPPLSLVRPEVAAATAADPVVAEGAALQRATAERQAALALDRAGRHAESRARMRSAATLLAAAPMTARVQEDLLVTAQYAAVDAGAAYGELDRKRATWQNALRRRGRRDDREER